jgi:hypothetical protein
MAGDDLDGVLDLVAGSSVLRVENLLNVPRASLWPLVRPLCSLRSLRAQSRTSCSRANELLPNDPCRTVRPSTADIKPIMHGGNRSDAFSYRSVDEQSLGSKETFDPPTTLRARSACFRYSSQPGRRCRLLSPCRPRDDMLQGEIWASPWTLWSGCGAWASGSMRQHSARMR